MMLTFDPFLQHRLLLRFTMTIPRDDTDSWTTTVVAAAVGVGAVDAVILVDVNVVVGSR